MDTFDTLDDRLTATLNAATRAMDVAPGKPGRAIHRAAHIRHRRRRASLLATSAVLVAATIGVVQMTAADNSRRLITITDEVSADTGPVTSAPESPSTDPIPTSTANPDQPAAVAKATIVPSPLTWQTVEPTRRIPFASVVESDPTTGALYAVSTQPGMPTSATSQPVVEAIKSTDGLSLQTLGEVGLGVSRSMAVYDGKLYALGTATFTGSNQVEAPEPVIRTSSDGVSWTTTHLLADFAAVRARLSSLSYPSFDVAAGSKGVVVAQGLGAFPDELVRMIPGFSEQFGFSQVADGLWVYGPPCPNGWQFAEPSRPDPTIDPDALANNGTCTSTTGEVQLVPSETWRGPGRLWTWAELGVDAADVALYQSRPRFYSSTDGTTFAEVSPTLPDAPQYAAVKLFADADGFVAAALPLLMDTNNELLAADIQVMTSGDGVNWTNETSLPDSTTLYDVTRVDGWIVVVSGTATGDVVIHRQNAAGWQTIRTPDIVGSALGTAGTAGVRQVAVGEGRIALALDWSAAPPDRPAMRIEHRAYTLLIDATTGEMTITDEAGAELDRTTQGRFFTDRVRRRADGGWAVVDEQGNVVDAFTAPELQAAGYAVSRPESAPYIALSTDLGATWSVTPLAEFTGTNLAYVGTLALLPNGGVLTQLLVNDRRQVVLGSPTGS